jgi:hypothetical protein
MDASGSSYAPATLLPAKQPSCKHWTRYCVGPRVCVCVKEMRKITLLRGIKHVHSVRISSLYSLSHLSCFWNWNRKTQQLKFGIHIGSSVILTGRWATDNSGRLVTFKGVVSRLLLCHLLLSNFTTCDLTTVWTGTPFSFSILKSLILSNLCEIRHLGPSPSIKKEPQENFTDTRKPSQKLYLHQNNALNY